MFASFSVLSPPCYSEKVASPFAILKTTLFFVPYERAWVRCLGVQKGAEMKVEGERLERGGFIL